MLAFDQRLRESGRGLTRTALETLQVNFGKKCNQACRHCHVDAAPWRTEAMDQATAEKIGHWILRHRPPVVDLTGGAPELNPSFRFLVKTAKAAGSRVIDRNNLTILEEPGFEDLPEFLASQEVEVIASLPCYLEENVQRQRGHGVFQKSIRGLRRLNQVGYGTSRILHLVYNPLGPRLPPPQEELEKEYREALWRDHRVTFNRLFTLTNQPIARFAEDLKNSGQWEAYQQLLVESFNFSTLEGLMCRNTLSVGYRGDLYDCDFNQMLNLSLPGREKYLWEIHPDDLLERGIATGQHCYACTAGAGSSCTGSLAGVTDSTSP